MKRLWTLALAGLLLTGCGGQEPAETKSSRKSESSQVSSVSEKAARPETSEKRTEAQKETLRKGKTRTGLLPGWKLTVPGDMTLASTSDGTVITDYFETLWIYCDAHDGFNGIPERGAEEVLQAGDQRFLSVCVPLFHGMIDAKSTFQWEKTDNPSIQRGSLHDPRTDTTYYAERRAVASSSEEDPVFFYMLGLTKESPESLTAAMDLVRGEAKERGK